MFFRRKKKASQPKEEIIDYAPQPLDPSMYGKLVDGELPTGWLDFHREFLQYHDSVLLELKRAWQAAEQSGDEASAQALKEQYEQSYAAYRAECEARGECFVSYFERTFS